MNAHAGRVVETIGARDWDALRGLLHPYVHWTDRSGVTLRGRTSVMARLASRPQVSEPRSWELRDGQVYRWEER